MVGCKTPFLIAVKHRAFLQQYGSYRLLTAVHQFLVRSALLQKRGRKCSRANLQHRIFMHVACEHSACVRAESVTQRGWYADAEWWVVRRSPGGAAPRLVVRHVTREPGRPRNGSASSHTAPLLSIDMVATTTILPSNLRQTTRERVYILSRDKDGGHTIRFAIAENPMLHANFMALLRFLHCGDRVLRAFSLVWPWPWTDDLHIWTWPVSREDIPQTENELSVSRLSKVIVLHNTHEWLAGTNLYCLVNRGTQVWETCPGFLRRVPGRDSNPRHLDRKSDTLRVNHWYVQTRCHRSDRNYSHVGW